MSYFGGQIEDFMPFAPQNSPNTAIENAGPPAQIYARRRSHMIQSHVIDIRGVFAGIAVRTARNFRFICVHPSLADLHESEWCSLSAMHSVVSRRFNAIA